MKTKIAWTIILLLMAGGLIHPGSFILCFIVACLWCGRKKTTTIAAVVDKYRGSNWAWAIDLSHPEMAVVCERVEAGWILKCCAYQDSDYEDFVPVPAGYLLTSPFASALEGAWKTRATEPPFYHVTKRVPEPPPKRFAQAPAVC